MVSIDHILQNVDRTLPIILWFMRIDRACIEQFARGIHNSDLAARAKSGVDTQDNVMSKRWLAQQSAQIVGEYLNGMVICKFAFFAANITLNGGQ